MFPQYPITRSITQYQDTVVEHPAEAFESKIGINFSFLLDLVAEGFGDFENLDHVLKQHPLDQITQSEIIPGGKGILFVRC